MSYANYCLHHNVKFSSEYQFVVHQLSCNYLAKPFVCNLLKTNGSMCGEFCQNGSTLALHALEVHALYICSECEFVTKSRLGLKYHDHIGLSGGRLRKFIIILLQHIYITYHIHSMLGPYKCKLCVKTYASLKALKMHMYYHAIHEAEWEELRLRDNVSATENIIDTVVYCKNKNVTRLTCYLCNHLSFGCLRDLRKHFAKNHLLPPCEENAKNYFKQLYNIAKLKRTYGKHKK